MRSEQKKKQMKKPSDIFLPNVSVFNFLRAGSTKACKLFLPAFCSALHTTLHISLCCERLYHFMGSHSALLGDLPADYLNSNLLLFYLRVETEVNFVLP